MIKPEMHVKKEFSDMSIFESTLKALESMHVENGVLSGVGAHPNSKAGATVASIAAWNEFGTARTPSRPFMRNGYAVFKRDNEFIKKAMLAFVFAKDGERLRKSPAVKPFFGVCGMKIQSLMVAQIDSGLPPENAPLTIERKGSAHTLLDTGILKKSLSYEVVNN